MKEEHMLANRLIEELVATQKLGVLKESEQKQLKNEFLQTLSQHLHQLVSQMLPVIEYLINKKRFHIFQLSQKSLSDLAIYVQICEEKDLQIVLRLIQTMFFQQNESVYSTSQNLFKSLVKSFNRLSSQNSRIILCEILVQMLIDNEILTQYADSPYYFLEYLIFFLNSEKDSAHRIYLFNAIQKLYARKDAYKHLFNGNDFRTLVDILVSNLENCTEKEEAKAMLICYQSFTKNGLLLIGSKNEQYRLSDIIAATEGINCEEYGLGKQLSYLKQLSGQ